MIGLTGLIGGFVAGATCTRASMAAARALNIVDLPGEIKVHKCPTPRFGGLGIVAGTLVGALAAAFLGLRSFPPEFRTFFGGGLIMAITGAVDDIKSLTPLCKLFGQVIAGVAFATLSWTDSGISNVWPFPWVSAVVATVFIVFMSNSVNLLDGMDGLAAGSTVVMGLCLWVIAFSTGHISMVLVLMAMIGACLGFMIYNVPPAQTFMGDTGSLFLGYALAATALELIRVSAMSAWQLLGVILVLSLPIIDTVLAILRRLRRRGNVLLGDRFHIYDCVFECDGKSTWKTIGIAWGLSIVLGAAGLLVFYLETPTVAGLALLLVACVVGAAIRIGALGPPNVARTHSRVGLRQDSQ